MVFLYFGVTYYSPALKKGAEGDLNKSPLLCPAGKPLFKKEGELATAFKNARRNNSYMRHYI